MIRGEELYTQSFQERVIVWVANCLGVNSAESLRERHLRFLEEALELSQAGGLTKGDLHALLDSVYKQPPGELSQEIGGAMMTLAVLAEAHRGSLGILGERELGRVTLKSDEVREKDKAKIR